jgi:urease accessory protein
MTLIKTSLHGQYRGLWLLVAGLVSIGVGAFSPAQAHHFAHLSQLQPGVLNGVFSGLAHPVLGPDHLLFLLALSLVGLQRRLSWSLGLLAVGLLGSGAGLFWPGLPAAESLVASTLIVEALVLLRLLPAFLLLPAMALHGYVLSGPVFGWSAMPVVAYGAGLLLSQAALLAVALLALRPLVARLSSAQLRWLAFALLALGGTWALVGLAA